MLVVGLFEDLATEQLTQGRDLDARPTLLKPHLHVPLALRDVVRPGVDQAQLHPIGEQGEGPVGLAQPLDHARGLLASAADPQRARPTLDGEHGQDLVARPLPQATWSDRAAGDGIVRPVRANLIGLAPTLLVEAEQLLEHDIQKPAEILIVAIVEDAVNLAAEAIDEVGRERLQLLAKVLDQLAWRDQQALVLKRSPPAIEGVGLNRHWPTSGKRISTVSGNTCTPPPRRLKR